MAAKGSKSPRFMTILFILLIFASASTINESSKGCIDAGFCDALTGSCNDECMDHGYSSGTCKGGGGRQNCSCNH
ncbi:hypothetical protein MRB53_035536 [Persea americana]|uniref:Uncharacterized protein n=1 Tax=Persea americana TaxID=3435 RepID=A0ACC2K4W8_PERAE|nr:hypothetical protein MRB53_035536 [Persea americana]